MVRQSPSDFLARAREMGVVYFSTNSRRLHSTQTGDESEACRPIKAKCSPQLLFARAGLGLVPCLPQQAVSYRSKLSITKSQS